MRPGKCGDVINVWCRKVDVNVFETHNVITIMSYHNHNHNVNTKQGCLIDRSRPASLVMHYRVTGL